MNGAAEGQPAIIYGASYAGQDNNNRNSATRYINRLARRFGFTLTNQAVGGYTMLDACTRAFGSGGTFPTPFGGIVFIEGIINDILHNSGTTTGKVADSYRHSLSALLLLAMASARTEETSGAFVYTSGTWSSVTAPYTALLSGGSVKGSPTNGATLTITTPVGTDFALMRLVLDEAQFGGTNAQCTVAVDGGAAAAPALWNGASAWQANASYLAPTVSSLTQAPLIFRGLSNAAHTIVVVKDSAGQQLNIDVLLTISATPPPIIVPLCPYFQPAGYPSGVSNSTVEAVNTITLDVIARVKTQFPQAQITAVDLNAAGWNPTTMIGAADHLHANDLGQSFIASALAPVVAALPFSGGLAKL